MPLALLRMLAAVTLYCLDHWSPSLPGLQGLLRLCFAVRRLVRQWMCLHMSYWKVCKEHMSRVMLECISFNMEPLLAAFPLSRQKCLDHMSNLLSTTKDDFKQAQCKSNCLAPSTSASSIQIYPCTGIRTWLGTFSTKRKAYKTEPGKIIIPSEDATTQLVCADGEDLYISFQPRLNNG